MMGRFLAGSLSALLLVAAGLFWWTGHAERGAAAWAARPKLNNASQAMFPDRGLPKGDPNAVGAPPPMPPQADARTRERKRFDRYDRNHDGIITRRELMASRAAAFRRLDKDGNNLLSFEEWAVHTSDRFAGADANHDGKLTPAEFATTAPKRKPKKTAAKCDCEGD